MKLFWERVEIKNPEECWPWRLSRYSNGYGKASIKDRTRLAHRLSWEITNGKIPKGLNVCHRCDNPICVNPNHLFLASQKDNIRDCVRKIRQNNNKKTHCKQGHPYSSSNLLMVGKWRRCKICVKKWASISYFKRKKGIKRA